MTPYPDYPIPANEEQRLRALRRFAVLDAPADPHFDRIVALASEVLGMPIALVSLVDQDRQWFLARHGLEVQETPRTMAFSAARRPIFLASCLAVNPTAPPVPRLVSRSGTIRPPTPATRSK